MTPRRIDSTIAALIAAVALTLGLGMAVANADTAPTDDRAWVSSTTGAQPAKPKKVKTLIFGLGSEVEGGVVGPDGVDVSARGELIHSSLLRVRVDFIPEIFKSAENL